MPTPLDSTPQFVTGSGNREFGASTEPKTAPATSPQVSARAVLVGLLAAAGLAALHVRLSLVAGVDSLGGIHLPFGAVAVLALLILGINGPLQWVARCRGRAFGGVLRPWSRAELLTIYAMGMFSLLVSTPGTDNFFLTVTSGLFYFSTRENGWADLFYKHIPSWLAPGWDGRTFQEKVIEPLYLGGASPSQIPWHAWVVMLSAWGLFLSLCYGLLFFTSLLIRRQWIESEALSFPLLQLPLEMVDNGDRERGTLGEFWSNRLMWGGALFAFCVHGLNGLNRLFPDWPVIPGFHATTDAAAVRFALTEAPWNAIGTMGAEFWLGAIAIAYLLTRELSFSLWFFLILSKMSLVWASQLGYPAASLPKDSYLGRPLFQSFASMGGWWMLGGMLLWALRADLGRFWRSALRPSQTAPELRNEPFAPRTVVFGWVFCLFGLLGWSYLAGMNLSVAAMFFAIYGVTSLVLARLVVEAGFLFPQLTFAPLDWLTKAAPGTSFLGEAGIVKVSLLQPVLMSDARPNTLPAWLHTLKIAEALRLDKRDTRRLLLACTGAIATTMIVATFATLVTLYGVGGLSTTNTWFTKDGPEMVWKGAGAAIRSTEAPAVSNWVFTALGALAVLGMTLARARFPWFPLHPLGFVVSTGYPMERLWFSIFLGWGTKTLILKYGGTATAARVRVWMLGLILGNIAAMLGWILIGYLTQTRISFWPA